MWNEVPLKLNRVVYKSYARQAILYMNDILEG